MKIDLERCNGCGLCVKDCPVAAISLQDKKAVIGPSCVECHTCFRVCPRGAALDEPVPVAGAKECTHCPVGCRIPEGLTGACGRYKNQGHELVRSRPLLTYAEVAAEVGPEPELLIERPSITAIGAGAPIPTTCPRPISSATSATGWRWSPWSPRPRCPTPGSR